MLLLALFSLLQASLAIKVKVEVFSLENELLATQEVEFEAGLRGDAVMHRTQGLGWKFTKMSLGSKELSVVTEISGLKATLPATAWVLTHRSSAGETLADNVGMEDIFPGEGDTLHWRYWKVSDLAAASKLKTTAKPTPKAAVRVEEEEEEEDDASAIARERAAAASLLDVNPGTREVGVVEEEGESTREL